MADVRITLPNGDKLAGILAGLKLEHFDEKMDFSAKMGGQKFVVIGLVNKISLMFRDYEKEGCDRVVGSGLRLLLIRELLRDYPESIKVLEEEGLL